MRFAVRSSEIVRIREMDMLREADRKKMGIDLFDELCSIYFHWGRI